MFLTLNIFWEQVMRYMGKLLLALANTLGSESLEACLLKIKSKRPVFIYRATCSSSDLGFVIGA
jgi:hypothetical protein